MAEEVDGYLALYNELRRHEGLGFRLPIKMYRLKPHLCRGLVSKKLDTVQPGALCNRHPMNRTGMGRH